MAAQRISCQACDASAYRDDRFCRQCGTPLTTGPSSWGSRKHVVVLFIDLIGSTAIAERMDPEPLRVLMERYYRACTGIIGGHGGVVEKFIGDAVMAVFGFPLAHEDDGLRAVHAAVETVRAVRALSSSLSPSRGAELDVHCGVYSGEVVATSAGGDLRVVGDAVNTAARLQSAAKAGEVLVGREVAFSVRSRYEMAEIEPLVLKGKSEPVRAWLVGEPRRERDDGHRTGLVGRADELRQLGDAYRHTRDGRRSHVVRVLGGPGIGKTRLVREFLASCQEAGAKVLTGRCHSYGKEVTYRPVAEMIDGYPGGWDALAGGVGGVARVREAALRGLRAAAGGATLGVEEIAWAVRHWFSCLAETAPALVVVFDDLHWAEPTLLALVEAAAEELRTVPVLLVCVARPDLMETSPRFGGVEATTVELNGLARADMEAFLTALSTPGEVEAHHASDELAWVVEASGGNPLYAAHMLDMLREGAPATIPPTVNALLSARIDRLPDGERTLLARAATIGPEFSRELLAVLAGPDDSARAERAALSSLLRRRLVETTDGSAYRFAQALTRDVAYAMTPKALRLDWHTRVADVLSRRGDGPAGHGDRTEVAYHLEAACLLGRALDPGAPEHGVMALRAARALEGAGMRAVARKDLSAGIALLERGRAVLTAGEGPYAAMSVRLSDAWLSLGDRVRAFAALDDAGQALAGNDRARRLVDASRLLLGLRFGVEAPDAVTAGCARIAGALLDDPEDHFGWSRLHQVQALSALSSGRIGQAESELRLATARARAMGDEYEEKRLLIAHCELAQWSPEHVDTGIELCVQVASRYGGDRAFLVPVLVTRARLTALRGDIGEARQLLATAGADAEELRLTLARASVAQARGAVESLAGDHAEAARCFERAARVLAAAGHAMATQTLLVSAARERVRAGLPVAHLDGVLGGGAAGLEPRAEVIALAVRARVAGGAGDADTVMRLGSAAVERLGRVDDPVLHAEVLFDLAEATDLCGHPGYAAELAERAREHYRARGVRQGEATVTGWLVARRGGGRPG
ncbi:ATP-binding protein [Phytohabitans suffuscus]|uniref:Guanylate cyclase n=1 Tax=Phytohabitans suffuscus TaxID=624315 RepID=A0A6F8YA89_9ACTN|nr:adenylate/guanylate cyclase domain-containing protein [Phytohabitans suffuscus]BCB82898.1 guanylate cyclase [Phytohabitans suffuscus]